MSGRTPSQTVGPYFALGLTQEPQNRLVAPDAPDAVRVVGRVVDGLGSPVGDAMVELWQPTASGTAWGRCATDADGRFEFTTAKPPAADDEAPFLDVLVFARGLLRHVATRLYFADEEEANAADPVLAGLQPDDRATLVAVPEDAALRFDIHLQGERQTVFFAL